MEVKGRITDIKGYVGKRKITFETEYFDTASIAELYGKELRIKAEVWREKRSLDANAYYWSLIGKVSDKIRISKSRLHNDMLRHYGQLMTVDDRPVCVMLPDTEEAEETARNSDTIHLKPTSATVLGDNGKTYRQYVMLKGSHEYRSDEMSVLIDGIIQEAKALGIETLSRDELAAMFGIKIGKEVG